MQCNCVGCIVIAGWCEMNYKKQMLVLVFCRLVCRMFIFRYFCLNQYHQLFPSIPSQNGVSLVYVSFVTFIFSCCGLMDNPHSCMSKVHLIITTSSSFVSTPFGPIFLDMVFPFRWSIMELIGMFHDLMAFLRECVLLSTTSIVASNASSIHMPLLVLEAFDLVVVLFFCFVG